MAIPAGRSTSNRAARGSGLPVETMASFGPAAVPTRRPELRGAAPTTRHVSSHDSPAEIDCAAAKRSQVAARSGDELTPWVASAGEAPDCASLAALGASSGPVRNKPSGLVASPKGAAPAVESCFEPDLAFFEPVAAVKYERAGTNGPAGARQRGGCTHVGTAVVV